MTEAAQIRCSTYPELIEGLKLRKAQLEISDQVLDELAGFCPGHVSKIFNGDRGLGAATLQPILDALAVDLVIAPSAEKMRRLGDYDRRDSKMAHPNSRVGKGSIERARPIVLSEFGRLGGLASASKLTGEQRSAKARKAARRRWKLAMLASRAAA